MLSDKAFEILHKDLFKSGQMLLGAVKHANTAKGKATHIEVIGKGYSYIHEVLCCPEGKVKHLNGYVRTPKNKYPLSQPQKMVFHLQLHDIH